MENGHSSKNEKKVLPPIIVGIVSFSLGFIIIYGLMALFKDQLLDIII